jgi:hypothetical protein
MRATRLSALLLLAAAPLGAVTVDTFTTTQAAISDPPGGNSTATGGAADPIGTRRGMVIDNLIGAGPSTSSVAGGNLVLTVTATTPDSRGEVRLSWDADTTPLVLSPTGLGNANLTTGNATGFRLAFVSSTVVSEVEITVYDDASNFSKAARRLPVMGGATEVLIPFGEFRVAGGTGAVFSSVGAIEMTLRSGEGTVTLNEMTTTPPVLAATKVDTQIVDNDGDTRVDPGDRLRYTVTITNTGNQAATVDLTDTVDPNTALVGGSTSSTPIARNDQYGWFGNVTLTADGTPHPLLLANDSDPDGDTISVQSGSFPATSAAGGTLTLVDASDGEFTYSPPAGFKGVDSFSYTIVDDNSNASTATAYIQLQGVVWFVDDSNTTPPHLGTQADPFQTLASVNGTDPDEPGDIVFLYDDDGTPYPGGHTMEADQQLVGQGVGLVLGGETIVAAGGTPQITNAGGTGLVLAANNQIRGFDLQGTSQDGIAGGAFGTLTASSVNVTSIGGSALFLTNGALAATFGTLSTSGTFGATGIELANVSGNLTATSTSLTNPAGSGILVTNSPAVTINFGPTTITDSAIGSGVTATGVDLDTGNNGATFIFPSLNLTTDGPGFIAANTTVAIQGTASSIVATNGVALDLVAVTRPNLFTFATVSSTNSVGKGVNLDANPGGNGLVINGGTITGSAGVAFDINGGLGNVTYAGSLTNTANARLIEITNRLGADVSFSGNLSSTGNGNGILVQGNTGGTQTITFSGATKTLSTGSDPAVTLDTNGAANIHFTGGGLDIDTTSATGFNATGGAAGITVQGTGNSITSTTGTALSLTGSAIGSSGLTFSRIDSNGGTNGIVLDGTGSNGLTVTGDGTLARNGSGGTINNKSGDAVVLTNANNVSLRSMNLTNNGANPATAADAAGVTGSHTVQVSGGSNIVLSGVHIQGTRGTGFLALNVGGTNQLNNNTRFEDTLAGAGHNLYVNNTNTNMTLFEINNVQMLDNAATHTNFFFANTGTSNMTLEIENGSLFEDLGTQAVTLAAGGTAATTGTLTTSVIGATFQNAKGLGENNLGVLVGNGAAHVATVQGNTFSNIAKDGTIANTSILRTQNSGGRMTATINGNTIQNIAYAAGFGGRHVIGHVYEPVAYVPGDFSNLIIQNNVVSNVTFPSLGNNREAVFIDYRVSSSNGEVSILNNNFNMPTAGAQQAIELRFRPANASTYPVLLQGNTISHNTAANLVDVDAEDAANVQLTINTNNNLSNTSGTPGATIAVASEDPAATGGPPSFCVNISGNTLQSGAGTILLDETAGTMTVTQASTAAMAGANGIPAGNVTASGTPTFGVAPCVLP